MPSPDQKNKNEKKRKYPCGHGPLGAYPMRAAPESPTISSIYIKDVDSSFLRTPGMEERLGKKIKSYHPFKDAGTPSPNSGFPKYVKTQSGTKLLRHKCFGLYAIYLQNGAVEVQQTENEEFSLAHMPQLVSPPKKPVKFQEVLLTKELLQQYQEEHNGNKRRPSQAKTMVRQGMGRRQGSINKITRDLGLNRGHDGYEWLHLIAWCLIGNKGQVADNLVAGTHAANTDMTLVEREILHLLSKYPDGVHLSVKADLIPGTHIATKIYYTIKTPHFELQFVFDAQTKERPSKVNVEYLEALVDRLVEKTAAAMEIVIPGAEAVPEIKPDIIVPKTGFFSNAKSPACKKLDFDAVSNDPNITCSLKK